MNIGTLFEYIIDFFFVEKCFLVLLDCNINVYTKCKNILVLKKKNLLYIVTRESWVEFP